MLELVSRQDSTTYKACDTHRGETRPMFELRLGDGLSYSLTYAHLRVTRADLRNPDRHSLTLWHAIGTATLTGRNLHELKDKLSTHALSWVTVYDPDHHTLPDEDAPTVTGISFTEAATPYSE